MASETEEFICPYCLVGFASSGKLQSHFVDMHSGQGQVDDYDIVEYGNVDGDGDVSEGEGRFSLVQYHTRYIKFVLIEK